MFILAGIISAISFFVPGIQLNNNLINNGFKYFDIKLLFGSAISLILFNIFLIFAFSSGGSLAIIITNLQLLVTILFGVFYLKEKINYKIWLAIIIYLLSGIYIVYEKNRIKN